ncbi:hypothetical protein [Anoxybacter fermentans]|uniref:hypothetical protein n=1 Tax=Anoxybacter fermentans TaxID=1323375 RepID=UPI000F8C4E9C|nr:hypothetical protein [Anoxybacter fermentans]
MIRQPLLNILLNSLLNFLLHLFLVLSQYFRIDFTPSKQIDDNYSKLNSLDNPLPLVKPVYKDYQTLLAEAEKNGQPIKPVRRIKSLNIDVDECPHCGAPLKTISDSLDVIGMDIKNFSVKSVNINGLQKSLINLKHILHTIAYFVVMPSLKKNIENITPNTNVKTITALNGLINVKDIVIVLLILIQMS